MKKKHESELTVWLCVADLSRSIQFYEAGLGWVRDESDSEEEARLRSPDGRFGVTCVLIDTARRRYKNRFGKDQESLAAGSMLRLTVADVDSAFARALSFGGLSLEPPTEGSDGLREGCLRDPDGYLVSFVSRASP